METSGRTLILERYNFNMQGIIVRDKDKEKNPGSYTY